MAFTTHMHTIQLVIGVIAKTRKQNQQTKHQTNLVLEDNCQHAADYFAQENDDQNAHKLNKHAKKL